MTSQEVALRSGVSPELAKLGIVLQETDGARAIVIPDDVHENYNVLLPVSQITQADPDWTPSVRAVKLNPSKDGPHFYNQQSRLAPRKEALGLLADLAGVEYIHTERVSKDLLAEGERLGIKATVAIRRSDGRITTASATKTFDDEVEHRKIVRDVDKGGKQGADRDADIQRRWIQEREHGPRKVESKAINAALRQILHIPHTFTQAEAGKPFLVIGYSHTPADPETRRQLAQHASRQLYGRELPQAPGDEGTEETGAPVIEHAPVTEGATEAAEPQQGAPATTHDDGDEDDFAGDQPEPTVREEQTAFPPPEAVKQAQEAGQYVIPFGNYHGMTLEQIAGPEVGDPAYVRKLAAADPKSDRAKAAKAAAEAYLPMLGEG